jgi:hypothetical protein
MPDIEESVSGFKTRGGWVDVVELGERVTTAIREVADSRDDVSVPDAAFDDWDEWRPKTDERLDEDVSEKTAEQASVGEGKGEQAGKEPDEDLQTAGEKLSESYDRLKDPDEAVDKWSESLDYVARAADSASRKALRKVEDTVYQNVMTQISPYYFDNELVSANLQRVEGDEGPDYILEVNINDDDLKIHVSNQLSDYEEAVDRWHIDAPKDVEAVEAAEGVEITEREKEVHGDDLDETTT